MKLRQYQSDEKRGIYAAYANGAKTALLVSPTGSGKTVLIGSILREYAGSVRVIAHRQELVAQMSHTLARYGITHNIIAPDAVRNHCSLEYYDPWSRVEVAGVDTVIRRDLPPVDLWVIDEAHHVLRENKWGRAVASCGAGAFGLGVTATPCRMDKKGLGREAAGVFDAMVAGPTMRELIDAGYLSDYRLFGPPSDMQVKRKVYGGDYSRRVLRAAVVKSRIIGDVVGHYLRIAPGLLGITFAPDVETAGEIAGQFNGAGVPAAAISAETPIGERQRLIDEFKAGRLLQLVNVDIFGEGFDAPACRVVSFARPTESYAVYSQQFGRALRPAPGKPHAIIIDHVGNVTDRHGLPDYGKQWTLDGAAGSNGNGSGAPAVRVCIMCTGVYERYLGACPYCGHTHKPAGRGSIEQVDGDLIELDPGVLAGMREAIAAVDMPVDTYRLQLASRRAPAVAIRAHSKRHLKRQAAQAVLREAIAWWAAYRRAEGIPDAESYRRFYLTWGVDVMTAQTLRADEALRLAEKIIKVNTKIANNDFN